MRIRRAAEADLDGIRRCLDAAFAPYEISYTPEGFRDTVPTREGLAWRMREMTLFVAEDEAGTIVGTIACQVSSPGEGHVRGMAVDPGRQGSGTADALLDAAEDALSTLGCTRVTLDTTAPLERAIRFYRRHGYGATGRVTDFFGMPLFEYAKDLRAR